MVDLYDTGAPSGSKRTRVHMRAHALTLAHMHIQRGTRVDQPAKTGSNVSHLMSALLRSHNTLQSRTHTDTHSHLCPHHSQLYPNQAEHITQRLCFSSLNNPIWFWFLTFQIEYDKNVFNFNLIYFPLCPQCLDCSFCSGNMPGISSVHYPSFPIRVRPEVCAGRAGLFLALRDGLTEAGIPGIRFPSGKQTKTFQWGMARVPTQQ